MSLSVARDFGLAVPPVKRYIIACSVWLGDMIERYTPLLFGAYLSDLYCFAGACAKIPRFAAIPIKPPIPFREFPP